jgi:DNA polymerase-3 subunit epsilon
MAATSKWDGFDCLGFDLESTGVDVWHDRIVTAALVAIWADGTKRHLTSYVVDPGIDIPEGAAAVHGYTRDRAIREASHADPSQALFEISGRLATAMGRGIPIVGANLSYDFSLLESENRRLEVPTLVERMGGASKIQPVVDVMVLDKKADSVAPYRRRRGSRKLSDLCSHYGVRLDDAHDSGADALAACLLWPKIMAKYPKSFPGHSLSSLHQSQVGWRKEQADGLREYFDRKGQEHDGVCGEWPLHRACSPALVAGGAR